MKSALCLFALVSGLSAASVELSWDRHPDLDVTGYIAYWGLSTQYTDSMDAGRVERALIDNLQSGSTYYFAVRAYDRSRNLGALSAPLSFAVAPTTGNTGNVPAAPVKNVLTVYPNPFAGGLNVTLSGTADPGTRIFIYDVAGRLVREYTAGRAAFAQKVFLTAPGLYVVRARVNGKTYTQKALMLK